MAPTPNATIDSWRDVNDALAVFTVRADGAPPAFEPGQYATLGMAGPDESLVQRHYSIASAREAEVLEFCVVAVDAADGLTQQLWSQKAGARLWLDPEARGGFTLDRVGPDCDLVMVCTGTGVSPYLSMLRTFAGTGRWRRAVLIQGVRTGADLAYAQELAAVTRRDPSVGFIPIASREPAGAGWPGRRGHVDDLFTPEAFATAVGWPLDPAAAHVFLCGNPAMIDQTEKTLQGLGWATYDAASGLGNIHFERYW